LENLRSLLLLGLKPSPIGYFPLSPFWTRRPRPETRGERLEN
jgi:hypothetical protein